MSFVINEEKVAELLKSSNAGYSASGSEISPTIENYVPIYSTMVVSGTSFASSYPVSKEAREQLLTIRRRIVKSGKTLKSADELTEEIAGMRGGSR